MSFLSTAAGITPQETIQRKHAETGTLYPKAFEVLYKSMGGVDLHDQHCSDLNIANRRKKWIWTFFFLELLKL